MEKNIQISKETQLEKLNENCLISVVDLDPIIDIDGNVIGFSILNNTN